LHLDTLYLRGHLIVSSPPPDGVVDAIQQRRQTPLGALTEALLEATALLVAGVEKATA